MKKCLALLLTLVCLLTLVACNLVGNHQPPYFTGKVIEKYENSCLIEVTNTGNGHFAIGDKIEVKTSIENCPNYEVGDYLRIVFDVVMAESYPPQIQNVKDICKEDSKGNSIE